MRTLLMTVLMTAGGTAWGQSLESALSVGGRLALTARTQGAALTAKGSLPCTPEAGDSWCFAPNREAAFASLTPRARSLTASGLKVHIGGLMINLARLAGKTDDSYLKGELREMSAAFNGLQGEALLKTFLPAESKPTVDIKGEDVVYNFNVHLQARIGSRKEFIPDAMLKHLAEKYRLYCAEYSDLVLFADRAGNPRGEDPVQTDLDGCVAE